VAPADAYTEGHGTCTHPLAPPIPSDARGNIMSRFAVSSWSLDGLLHSGTPLLELPSLLRQHHIGVLELCHFHLPHTTPDYLEAFRERLAESGIELFSILIDAGDITAPDPEQRKADVQFVRTWIDLAATLGATRVRIDAGRQEPSSEVVQRSARQLRELIKYAAEQKVSVSTENWHETGREPDALRAILDQCGGQLGLCVDTGNAEATADKYDTIAQLLPYATSIHFKARYTPEGVIEREDAQRCINLISESDFDGVISLIYDRKRDEWQGIENMRSVLQALQ
jgi:sugar phosphate isomerase/epimerase